MVSEPTRLVFLCTGNAARSVMAATMFADRTAGFDVISAGTHVIEGLPMSSRTRNALLALGHKNPLHRSHQLTIEDLAEAALIIAMEPGHLRYIERQFPSARRRAGLFPKLVELLELTPSPDPLADRVERFKLFTIEGSPDHEVVDPAGGEQPEFDRAAVVLDGLVDRLIAAIGRSDETICEVG